MTPVLVLVKKLSSIACRWVNSRTRRAPMTLLPTVAVSQVCQTPSSALIRKTPSMNATSTPSTERLGVPPAGKRPSSKARWVRSGGTTERAALTRTRTTVTMRVLRCGENSAKIRCNRCGMRGASAFSARCAAASAPLTRPRFIPTAGRDPKLPDPCAELIFLF